MNKKITLIDWGLKDYKEAWEEQEKLFQSTIDLKVANKNLPSPIETPNYLIFVEHPHVLTLGKSGVMEHLLMSEEFLKEKHISFYKVNRGGDITYHGLGQVVGYPILDLDNFSPDIHQYLRSLEEVIILTLADYGIKGERSKGETGVWIEVGTPRARKICAMGVRASRWVTMHGFALNVNTDLSYFNYIVPCGIADKAVASLEGELGYQVPLQEVKERITRHFLEIFAATLS